MCLKQRVALIAWLCWPALILAAPSIAVAQDPPDLPIPEDLAIGYAGIWFHGITSVSCDFRDQVLRDSATIDLYADLLSGERSTTMHWESGSALWWLAETGNPKYLGLFIEHYDADTEDSLGNQHTMAAYGIARLASIPAAREKLIAMAAAPDEDRRERLASVLAKVNTVETRSILTEADLTDYGGDLGRQIRSTLSGPPRSSPGTLGCCQSEDCSF